MIKEIFAKFIVNELPQIEVEPNYAAINDLIKGLYANSATLPTTLGGGIHRNVGLIMKYTIYANL